MAEFLEPGGRWNALLGAMATYINGTTFDQLVVREYARYRDSGLNHRVREGYGALIGAYASGLDVRTNCPATLIDHAGKRLRVVTPQGEIAARAAIVAVPPGILADETLRFSPALPDKRAAAHALPLGVADKVFLSVERAEDLPVETRLFASTRRIETGGYTLRPFGRPLIDGYFGGPFARSLELEEGGFANFAIDEICAALGNDMRKRLTPIVEFGLGARSLVARRILVRRAGRAGGARDACGAGRRAIVLRRRALLGCGFFHRARGVSHRRAGRARRDQWRLLIPHPEPRGLQGRACRRMAGGTDRAASCFETAFRATRGRPPQHEAEREEPRRSPVVRSARRAIVQAASPGSHSRQTSARTA